MRDALKEIWTTLSHNKLRTSLTGFAVAWGIFMLIALLGAGNGLLNAFSSNMAEVEVSSMAIFREVCQSHTEGSQKARPSDST